MKTPVSVLHVIHDLGFGGAQRLLADLASRTNSGKFSVAVASLYAPQNSPFEAELRMNNIRVFHLGKRRGPDVRALLRLDAVFQETEPQVVHSHCHALRYVLPFVLAGKIPAALHTVHNLAEIDVGRPHWLTAWTYRAGVVPVAIGKEVADSLERVFGIRNPPLIRNGIDVARFASAAPARAATRGALGLANEIAFLCAASLTPKKGHAVLLEAFARVVEKLPEARLLLAGAGPSRAELEKQISLLRLDSLVRFLGARTDMPELFAAADVFVLSSFWEGMPLSVMEAMAAGKPAVCTAVGGSAEIVENDATGLLVPPRDPARLAEAMLGMADAATRARLGNRAAATAAARFDVTAMVRAYESLYESLLSRKGG